MPRRRFITIAFVIAFGTGAYLALNEWIRMPYYQGHSAAYWLRQVNGPQADKATEAIREMGDKADDILIEAELAKDNPSEKAYRRIYPQLPKPIQIRMPAPIDPERLRLSAEMILSEKANSREVLYKLLRGVKGLNSSERMRELENIILIGMVGSSDNFAAESSQLCSDKNINMRMDAAVVLFSITGQTNIAVPVLKEVFGNILDLDRRHWAAFHLVEMGQRSDPSLIPVIIEALADRETENRSVACKCLGQMQPAAVAAIPALQRALQDPELSVWEQARLALEHIDPAHRESHWPSKWLH